MVIKGFFLFFISASRLALSGGWQCALRMRDYVLTILFNHQPSLSTLNLVQGCTSEFPKQFESNEFLREICKSSYTLKNNFAGARPNGELLNSDVSMHTVIKVNQKGICQNIQSSTV